jgi:hypothetical protein
MSFCWTSNTDKAKLPLKLTLLLALDEFFLKTSHAAHVF